MSKTRMFQALWLLLLSLVCVLMFYYRRESTKYPQEKLSDGNSSVVFATDTQTPVVTLVPTPVPTVT